MHNPDVEKKFFDVFDEFTDPVRLIDSSGYVLYANTAMNNVFGDSVGSKDREHLFVRNFDDQKSRVKQRNFNSKTYAVSSAPYLNDGGEVVANIEIFRDITEQVEMRNRLLTSNIQMVKNMQMARRMQTTLMNTPMPNVAGYEFYSDYEPCDAVGGDIFDCVMENEDTVIFFVGDVSGHGITAAMSTVFLKREMRTLCEDKLSLGELVKRIQRSFLETNADSSLYLTLFAVKLHVKTGVLEYVNAGHTVAPMVIKSGKHKELFAPGAPISSWFDKPEFGFGEETLQSGDRLYLYTDGVENLKFENDLTLAKLLESDRPQEEILGIIREANKGSSDDLVVLVCEKK